MTRPWHERLADPDQDVRYAAACALADASRIDERELRALVAALGDRGYGLVTVPDHNGGYQDDPDPIADHVERALRKHVAGHRRALQALAATANADIGKVLDAILAGAPR